MIKRDLYNLLWVTSEIHNVMQVKEIPPAFEVLHQMCINVKFWKILICKKIHLHAFGA